MGILVKNVTDRLWWRRIYGGAFVAFLALLLVAGVPFLSTAYISLITKILIFALLAMSLDLIYGYAGMWSFGQAGLFGIGAYTTGILIKIVGISSFWGVLPLTLITCCVLSAIFGFVALRVRGLYFLIVTVALGQLIFGVAMKWSGVTGGYNGLSGVPYPNIGASFSFGPVSFYYFVFVIAVVCFAILYLIVRSPFGYSLRGIRDAELRMRCLGYNTWLHKYIAFIISGVLAGIAGMLFVYFNGVIGPADIGLTASGEIMLMVMLGGSGTLWGATTGATLFLVFKYFISLVTPARWPLIIGVLFIVVVMFLRGGVWPRLSSLFKGSVRNGTIEGPECVAGVRRP